MFFSSVNDSNLYFILLAVHIRSVARLHITFRIMYKIWGSLAFEIDREIIIMDLSSAFFKKKKTKLYEYEH